MEKSIKTISSTTSAQQNGNDQHILDQVGCLTRNLHNNLRELGYYEQLESLVAEVPDTQDKLAYVAAKTEQGAEHVLDATEIAMPIQEKLSLEASQLAEKWKAAFDEQMIRPDTERFRLLLMETLDFIENVPAQADATNAQLMEIMMAMSFQDLTGQVIKKVTHTVQKLEHDLVQLLLSNAPNSEKKTASEKKQLDGPVTNPEKSPDTVNSQSHVDELLANLGF